MTTLTPAKYESFRDLLGCYKFSLVVIFYLRNSFETKQEKVVLIEQGIRIIFFAIDFELDVVLSS
jgi:hypothetical protein